MEEHIKKLRDFYAFKNDAPLYQREFGFFCIDKWIEQGYLKPYDQVADYDNYLSEIFGFDKQAYHNVYGLGWCEAPFVPTFDNIILEDKGDHEIVQDFAGRKVLYFKGKRHGFMPEYLDHPVKDYKSWEEKCKWRLDCNNKERLDEIQSITDDAVKAQEQKKVLISHIIGGYMYLRSLIGPLELLYMFYDAPELIHDCMQTWLKISDYVTARIQEKVSFDEVYLAEDICYNHGSLISEDMMKEFLFPYYSQLLTNIKSRQKDKSKTLHIHIDTDGYIERVINPYKSVGMDYMSPFEVASGSDVVEIGKKHPDLLIMGGIDKRILTAGKDDIDKMIDRIFPTMKKRGGFIPTCDHGVPEEVSFENYMHYRKRSLEYSK